MLQGEPEGEWVTKFHKKVSSTCFFMRRKLLLQVTNHPLLTRINSLLRKGGKGLYGRDALDDAFIVTDNDILSPEGFFFKHPTLSKIKSFLYLLTKFQYFFLSHISMGNRNAKIRTFSGLTKFI